MSAWNDPRPDSFCEGFLWKQIVPGFDEFFSGLSGVVIIFLGFLGLWQPRLEVLLRMIYASVVVSGVGTMMMHWKRINGFNLADTLPLLVTLTLGMIAFFDELIFEYHRPRGASGGILPVRNLAQEKRDERVRQLLTAIVAILAFAYLTTGILLSIYSTLFSIFGVYFGVPFGVLSIGGMIYINQRYRREKLPQLKTLRWLTVIAITNGLISIAYKIIDMSYCSQVTIWLFPHPLFHITLTYSTHCIIVFLAFHRANNTLMVGDPMPRVVWWLLIFPVLVVPPHYRLNSPAGLAPGSVELLDKEFAAQGLDVDDDDDDDDDESDHPSHFKGGKRRPSEAMMMMMSAPPAENPTTAGRRSSQSFGSPLRSSPSFFNGFQGYPPYNPYAVHPYSKS